MTTAMSNVINLHAHPRARAKIAGQLVAGYATRAGLNAAAAADEAQRVRVQVLSGASVARAVAQAKWRIRRAGRTSV
jgi:hypothetical protein